MWQNQGFCLAMTMEFCWQLPGNFCGNTRDFHLTEYNPANGGADPTRAAMLAWHRGLFAGRALRHLCALPDRLFLASCQHVGILLVPWDHGVYSHPRNEDEASVRIFFPGRSGRQGQKSDAETSPRKYRSAVSILLCCGDKDHFPAPARQSLLPCCGAHGGRP